MNNSENCDEQGSEIDPGNAVYVTLTAETSKLANELTLNELPSSVSCESYDTMNVSGVDISPAKVIQDGSKEEPSQENPIDMEGIDVEHSKEHQETTTRPSLVSEMSGSHYRKLLSDPSAGADSTTVEKQNLTYRRHIDMNPPLTSEVVERACEVQKDDGLQNKNACANSTFGEGSSLEKKRKKSDSVGETDSWKGCSCKRSKCLKLYCECFAAGIYCIGHCNCQDCFNKPDYESIVLEARRLVESRKPLAFAPKNELNRTSTSARHEKGCHCKKSRCIKKYCDCFQRGVGCSLRCRCESCINVFGRKEAILFEEAQVLKKCESNASSHHGVLETNHEYQAARELSNNSRKTCSRETCETTKNDIENEPLNSNEKKDFDDVMSWHNKPDIPMGMDQIDNLYVEMNDEIIEESGGSSTRSRTNEDGDFSILPSFGTPTSGTASRVSRLQERDASKENLGKEKLSISSHNGECTNEYCAMREKELEIMDKNRKQMVELEKHKGYVTLLNTLLAKTHLTPQEEAMKNDLIKIVMGKSF